MASKAVHGVMLGNGFHSAELGELFHLLHHVGHELKGAAEELLDPPKDDDKSRL